MSKTMKTHIAVARSHGWWRVRRAWAGSGLVVVRRLASDSTGTNSIAGENEGTRALEVELSGGLLPRREVKDEVADFALGLGNGQVKVEDGAYILGSHLRPFSGRESVIGLVLGDGDEKAGGHEGVAKAAIGLDGVSRAFARGFADPGGGNGGECKGQGAGNGSDLHFCYQVKLGS